MLWRDMVERELEEELGYHLDLEVRKNLSLGMPPAEARRQARISFGGVERVKEEVRERRWLGWVSGLSLDGKIAVRMLLRHPALSVIGGLGMAMGVAIGLGFFLFVSSFYFATLPFEEGDRIVAIENRDIRFGNESRRTSFDYGIWREELSTMEEIGAFDRRERNIEIPGGLNFRADVAGMTASGFRVTRVEPLLGRPIVDADEREGAPSVVVIGYDEWLCDFAGDSGLLGREIRINGVVHTVIGVMPEDFRFPVNDGYWIPLAAGDSRAQPGEGPELFVFGRLAPGVSVDRARAELRAVAAGISAEFSATHANLRPTIIPFIHPLLDIQGMPVWFAWLMVLASSMVLMVIAVNVGVLVYARTAFRQAEIAVRTALGASRRRIVIQFFIEALV